MFFAKKSAIFREKFRDFFRFFRTFSSFFSCAFRAFRAFRDFQPILAALIKAADSLKNSTSLDFRPGTPATGSL